MKGYNVLHGTQKTFFQAVELDPDDSKQLANSMHHFGMEQGFEFAQALDSYDWKQINDGKLTVVDVGGSIGGAMVYLAEKYPDTKCVVQDLPIIIKGCQERLPKKLRGRVSFQEHDFFKIQPVVGADVYFIRHVLHDWTDKRCTDILRALIPALKRGSRVLLNEQVLPEPGTLGQWQAREYRCVNSISPQKRSLN